jgi:hypothetical protein
MTAVCFLDRIHGEDTDGVGKFTAAGHAGSWAGLDKGRALSREGAAQDNTKRQTYIKYL